MTDFPTTSGLVSSEWLAVHLTDPGVVVLDATLTGKGTNPNGAQIYAEKHIPGALHFDVEKISDPSSDVPQMLPSPEDFAAAVGLLGIGSDTIVVAYDSSGMANAASRCWWMFRIFGHDRVAVLDGGLPKWLMEGRPVDNEKPAVPMPRNFLATFNPGLVSSLGEVKAISEKGGATLIDARSQGRFEGTAPEAWANGRGGHIPGSRSLPFTDLIDPVSKTLLPREQLFDKLNAAGLMEGPVVSTCGSGVTACVIALALHEVGRSDIAIYDGSWAEWGAHPELTAATGPA